MQLDLALTVRKVDERGSALVAAGNHPAGHAIGAIAFLAGLEIVDDSRGPAYARTLVREGADPLRAQARELGPAVIRASGGYSAFDLRDLELAGGAAGHLHADRLAALGADQGTAHGGLVRE